MSVAHQADSIFSIFFARGTFFWFLENIFKNLKIAGIFFENFPAILAYFPAIWQNFPAILYSDPLVAVHVCTALTLLH